MCRPKVAAIVVSFNTRQLTLEAVASLVSSTNVDIDIWLVDNASADGSGQAVRKRFPSTKILELRDNVGFGRANNAALSQVGAPYVLLLNSDAVLADNDGVARLVGALQASPRVGVVGPRLVSSDGQLEYSARAFPSLTSELARGSGLHRLFPAAVRERRLAAEFRDHHRAGPTDWLTGACLLIRGEVLREVGSFDPSIFLYGEELDWCWRVHRAGWEIRLEPDVVVVHRRGASGEALGGLRSRLAMAGDAYVVRKHKGWAYLALFAIARALGLALAAGIQSALWFVTREETCRRRSRQARADLANWVAAVAAGGARDPSAPRLHRRRNK